jgi:hypothetical protein
MHCFQLIQPPGELSVITFGADNLPGMPARQFYERMGFYAAEAAPNGPEGGTALMRRFAFRTDDPRSSPVRGSWISGSAGAIHRYGALGGIRIASFAQHGSGYHVPVSGIRQCLTSPKLISNFGYTHGYTTLRRASVHHWSAAFC